MGKDVLTGVSALANNLRKKPVFYCAGSASLTADFDTFMAVANKSIFFKLIRLCHKTFIPER
jgi:hypothetical protein